MKRVIPPLIVIAIGNVTMLAFAGINRTGAATSSITLTERELPLRRSSDRDSSQRLYLWFVASHAAPVPAGPGDEPQWLPDETLRALGFRCATPADPSGSPSWDDCGLSRRAFIAFEFDGPTWRKEADQIRQAAAARADTSRQTSSADAYQEQRPKYETRLLAIDAALDADALRKKYPDASRYLILPGFIAASRYRPYRPGPPAIVRTVSSLTVMASSIVVPRGLQAALPKDNHPRCPTCEPRYRVRLVVGSRYEPWIESIEPIDTREGPH